MPFKKITKKDINEILDNDSELKTQYEQISFEMEIIKQAKELRNRIGLTQKQVAQKSGLTQQMVSRIEKVTYVPSLENFLKYVNAIGLKVTLSINNN